MPNTNNKLPLPLLYFHGGGYSGCFWEPNLLVVEHINGRIRACPEQPCVSGYTGKEMVVAARHSLISATKFAKKNNGYWVKTEDQWRQFCKDIGEGFVRAFSRRIIKMCRDLSLDHSAERFYYIPCDACDSPTHPEEVTHWSYRGNGGIGISWDGLLCDDCHRQKHTEWVQSEWSRLNEKERKAAWERAVCLGYDVPDWEDVKDAEELPIDAECVYERDIY